MRAAALLWLAAPLIALGGCGDKLDARQLAECPDLGVVSYESHLAPLLERRCRGCHASAVSGGDRQGAPSYVNYDSFDDATRLLEVSLQRVSEGSMPPSTPLPACERRVFEAWAAQGALER